MKTDSSSFPVQGGAKAVPAGDRGPRLTISPRYYRLYTDPGVPLAERNFRHHTLSWRIPPRRVALVCVDVWDWHFAADTARRTEEVTRRVVAPLVNACRRAGLLVIHAPAVPVANRHPNWVRLVDENEMGRTFWPTPSPDWPPAEFRAKKGRYRQYARPHEIQDAERADHARTKRRFHPLVEPADGEPVIVNGTELHRLCVQRGILHLFYAGFHTNMCMIMRDYGTLGMMMRGYEVVLVRDATTGMELHTTRQTLACTRGVIGTLEQLGIYTITSGELKRAMRPLSDGASRPPRRPRIVCPA